MNGFSEQWLAEYKARTAKLRVKPPLPDRIEFMIPRLLKLPNKTIGTHWSESYRQRSQLRTMLEPILAPYIEHVPMERAKVTVTRFSCGATRPDWDNLAAGAKPLIDLLLVASKTHPRSFGIIQDDGPTQVIPIMFAERVMTRVEQRTEVIIERI